MPSTSRRIRPAFGYAPIILGAMAVCVALGFGIVVPVLPTFASSFGVGAFAASAVVSVFAFARLVMSPLVGRLDDRFGERKVLIAGLLIVAVSSAAAGFSASYVQLLVLRGLGGIGSAMFSVASMSILLGAVAPDLRGRATALYQGGFLIGGVAGPALGGLVGGMSMRAPFFVYAGTLVAAAAVASRLPRRARDDAGGSSTSPLRLGEVAKDVRFQAACVANFCQGWNSHGVRSALVPLFVAGAIYDDPRLAARWTGVAMAIAACTQVLALYPAGSIADKVGRRGPMIVGAITSAVAMAAIPFAGNMAQVCAVLALYAVASAISGTAPAALVGDVAGTRRDRAVAVFSMSSDVGAIGGPLVAGFLADRVSFGVAFGVGAIAWAASAALSSRIRPVDSVAPGS
ncbi:MAG: MFS transporter [Bifidobacteriaceae bacterium]|jgi:MFS family permease|nr:MFS transporter [Bifidobacteriaceae bacterium]